MEKSTKVSRIYTLGEIKEKLFPVFQNAPVYKAILFGSYARGDADEKSDIDIVIDSRGELINIHFYGVAAQIEDALKKDIDIFEISQIQRASDIKNAVSSEGVLLYER